MTTRTKSAPVQSLDRGLAILEHVGRAKGPVSLADLTELLGVDRSNTFRLANTLRQRGFLTQAPGTKDYVLGTAVWRLAEQVPWARMLMQAARGAVARLADDIGETAHLAIREGAQALFIDDEASQHALAVSGRTGHYESLHGTALGKALLVDFDALQLSQLFGRGPLEAATKSTITSVADLAKECAKIRRAGFATDDEESYEGVRCMGAPIRDASGEVVAAIGFSAPSDRFAKSRFRTAGPRVVKAALEVARQLGYEPEVDKERANGPSPRGRRKTAART